MRAALLMALVLLGTAPVYAAEEPSGCDKFKWPIERERAALTAPERTPKEGTFAGFAAFTSPPKAGAYTINLSAAGWIDVVQEGRFLRSVTSSGVRDCEGIRKSVKFEIPAKPFVLQISGVVANAINLAIVPASE